MKLMTQRYLIELEVDWIPDIEGQEIQAAALKGEVEDALRPVAMGLQFSVKPLPVEQHTWHKLFGDGSRVRMIEQGDYWWWTIPPNGPMIQPGPVFP